MEQVFVVPLVWTRRCQQILVSIVGGWSIGSRFGEVLVGFRLCFVHVLVGFYSCFGRVLFMMIVACSVPGTSTNVSSFIPIIYSSHKDWPFENTRPGLYTCFSKVQTQVTRFFCAACIGHALALKPVINGYMLVLKI